MKPAPLSVKLAPMGTPKRMVVTDGSGDGALLRLLPEAARRRLRPLALRSAAQRERRLLRVAERIFGNLQAIERAALPAPQHLLAGKDFTRCLADADCIERALSLFEVGWQTGLAELRPGRQDEGLSYGNARQPLGACGLSVADAVRYFVARAVALIFAANPRGFATIKPFLTDTTPLARLRLLAAVDAEVIEALHQGWGRRLNELLTARPDDDFAAIARLRPVQVRALRALMGQRFADLLDWPAARVAAVVESFDTAEQFRDLGEDLLLLTEPEAIRALGRWENRVVADRVETDIALMRRLLGGDFVALLERPPGVIDAFGVMLAELRQGGDVQRLAELARRYLAFLTSAAVTALTMLDRGGRDSLDLSEIIGVLDGLWHKPGLGPSFFAGPFQTREGAAALAKVVAAIVETKRRGTAKAAIELTRLIAQTDLFDRPLAPFFRQRRGT